MNSTESQQYKIISATVTADRFDGTVVEIANQIVELNVYENMEKSFLTGSILIVDDAGLFDGISFRGTERITIVLSSVDNKLEPFFEKTFCMVKIERSKKSNDRTEVYLISLIEEHVYLSGLTRISRSYTSELENIITQIITNDLKKSVDQSYLSPSFQGVRKVNIPYLTPIHACNFLLNRMTSQNGSPFFLFASIHDDNLRLGSLDTFLTQTAFNSKSPFVYSSSVSNEANSLTEDERSFIIESHKSVNMEDTLGMIEEGALVATYNNLSTSTGLVTSNKYNVRTYLSSLTREEILKSENEQTIFDGSHIINDKLIDQYPAKTFHQITNFGTYGNILGYNDVIDNQDHVLKLRKRAMRNFLYRNMINIMVPGTAFTYAKISVGDIINCNFITTRMTADVENSEELIDKNKSGDYIIYAARHIFKDSRHLVSLNISKIQKIKAD